MMILREEMMEEIRMLETEYLIQELHRKINRAVRLGLEDQGMFQSNPAH